jgi:DNA polymerase elongation subunit (family B)
MNKVVSTTGVDYVIASDTDSIYLHLDPLVQKVMPNTVDEEKITLFLDKVCNEVLQKEIAKRYQELATRMNAYEQKMNMKRESIASKGIWTAKKRYILNLRMGEENVYLKEAELKVTGIETVRSSTPEIVREALRNVISLIISKDESTVQEFVKAFRNQFEGLEAKAIASPRSCNGLKEYANESTIYKKGTPIATKGSLLFNWNLRKHKLRGKYQDIREGDKIKFIYLVTPNPIGDKVISFTSKIPKEFDLSGYIDYQLQFEKTFLDPLKHILAAVGWQAEHIDTLENLFN